MGFEHQKYVFIKKRKTPIKRLIFIALKKKKRQNKSVILWHIESEQRKRQKAGVKFLYRKPLIKRCGCVVVFST
jgi:hypothetical protein